MEKRDGHCSRCGHSKADHTDTVIEKGYGEGGYCAYWHDRMFGGTDECCCPGYSDSSSDAPPM